VRLRAHHSEDCTELTGFLRLGGQRVPFAAERIHRCGTGVRESGEQCDGADGDVGALGCCQADCRVRSGCTVACDPEFPCAAREVCVPTRFGHVCVPDVVR
jgi:hypothetical protein